MKQKPTHEELKRRSRELEKTRFEQKNAEEALLSSEERFRLAVLNSGIVFAQTDLDLRYTWIYNPHPDFDPETATGKTDVEIADNEGTRQLMRLKRKVVETGEKLRKDIVFPVSDGPRAYDVTAEPMRDKTGRIVGTSTSSLDITERKRMEENLKKYQNIVSSTPDGIAFLDENYRYIIVNDAYERFSGVKREKFIGLTVPEYLGEDVFRQHIKPHFDRCLKGETIAYREWFDYPTLGRRFVEVNYYPYRDTSGRIAGVVANTRDITERKRAENALRVGEERLRQAQTIAKIGDWSWDVSSGRVHWSDQMYEIFKVPRKEPDFEMFGSHVHPDDLAAWEACVREAIERQTPFTIDYRAVRPDGKIIWVHNQTKLVCDERGKFAGFQGVAQDVTERMAAQKALKESEERLRLSLAGSGVSFWEWFPESGRIHLENNWARSLGFDPERDVFDFNWWKTQVHPDSMPLFKKALGDYLDGKVPRYEQEYRIRTRKGEWKWIWAAGECVEWDGAGKPIRFLGTHRDITKTKRAEVEIRKLNETLEQRVAERTAELEDRARQLRRLALELSEAEDRERGNIASILHDDFQQQLAYVKMELGMLKKNADENTRDKMEALEQLIGECIDKSRDLSYSINPPALNRSGLLAAFRLLVLEMRSKHGLRVRLRTHPGAEPDNSALASILYRAARELLLNVAKHSGADSADMDLRLENGKIRIRLEDSGNGFDYRAVRSMQGRGTGFGLYNVEDRIAFLGGSFAIDAAPGKGCRIVLTVPRDISRMTADPAATFRKDVEKKPVQVESLAATRSMHGRGKIRILLADDHALMREALAKMLGECRSFEIVGQAVNGKEAIELAAKLKPHVILMDITMPVLNGFKAAKRISRLHPDIRIIGLSMHNDPDTRQKMLEAGASAYLTKTGSPDDLVETIRRVHRENE